MRENSETTRLLRAGDEAFKTKLSAALGAAAPEDSTDAAGFVAGVESLQAQLTVAGERITDAANRNTELTRMRQVAYDAERDALKRVTDLEAEQQLIAEKLGLVTRKWTQRSSPVAITVKHQFNPRKTGRAFRARVNQTANSVGKDMVRNARKNAPEKTGNTETWRIHALQVRDIGPVELRLIGDEPYTKFQEFGTIHIPAKYFMTNSFMKHAPRVGELSKRGGRNDYIRPCKIHWLPSHYSVRLWANAPDTPSFRRLARIHIPAKYFMTNLSCNMRRALAN